MGTQKVKKAPREDATYPTIKLESLLILLMIYAKEDRYVATADIVGTHLLVDMKEKSDCETDWTRCAYTVQNIDK